MVVEESGKPIFVVETVFYPGSGSLFYTFSWRKTLISKKFEILVTVSLSVVKTAFKYILTRRSLCHACVLIFFYNYQYNTIEIMESYKIQD